MTLTLQTIRDKYSQPRKDSPLSFYSPEETQLVMQSKSLNHDWELIDNDRQLAEALKPFHQAKIIGIDCETTGLDPYTSKVRLLQLAIANRPTLVIDLEAIEDLSILHSLLDNNKILKVGHNLKFDLMHLKVAGLPLSGPFFDTYLAWKVLTAGLTTKSSLEAIRLRLASANAFKLLDIALDKNYQTSDWSAPVLNADQLEYAAKDAAIVLPLYEAIAYRLKRAKLMRTAKIEFECLPGVAVMELNGMYQDAQHWQNLVIELDQWLSQYKGEINKILHLPIEQLSLFPEYAQTINPNSSHQVLAALQQLGIDIESTSSEALAPFAHQYPVIKSLVAYRKCDKQKAIATNLVQHVHPTTGRIHPNWFQIGARSGRFSCREPNLQNIPRDRPFRQGFTAPPGRILIKADYSQIELRILAKVSGDKRMCNAYRQGEDLHRLTASLLFDKPLTEVEKEERQLGKIVNFGLIYGMGAKRFQEMVLTDYNISLTLEEAKVFSSKFFESYPGIKNYHNLIRKKWQNGCRQSRTLDGRRRLWSKRNKPKLSEMINHPIQGLNASITKKAIALLHKHPLIPQTNTLLVGTVHDEIVLECPENQANKILPVVEECLVRAGSKFLDPIPVIVEAQIINSWGG